MRVSGPGSPSSHGEPRVGSCDWGVGWVALCYRGRCDTRGAFWDMGCRREAEPSGRAYLGAGERALMQPCEYLCSESKQTHDAAAPCKETEMLCEMTAQSHQRAPSRCALPRPGQPRHSVTSMRCLPRAVGCAMRSAPFCSKAPGFSHSGQAMQTQKCTDHLYAHRGRLHQPSLHRTPLGFVLGQHFVSILLPTPGCPQRTDPRAEPQPSTVTPLSLWESP